VEFSRGNGIYRDIDVSGCGFTSAPIITSSLAGTGNHWKSTGGSEPYSITATGFRILVYNYDNGITPSLAASWNWNINWIAARPQMSASLCSSSTASSGWVEFSRGNGIYRDIDVSGCGFTSAPIITSSLAGITGNHSKSTGGTEPYSITATGFRIHVYVEAGITSSLAASWNWNINWIAHPKNV
jgi:hypothetical protein